MKKIVCTAGLALILAASVVLLGLCIYLYIDLPAEPPVLDPDEPLPFLMLHDGQYLIYYIISLALIIVGFALLFLLHKTMWFYVAFAAGMVLACITSRDANFLVLFISLALAFLVSILCVKHGGYDY